MIGSSVSPAMWRKCALSSAAVGTYTIGGSTMSPVAPILSASFAKRAARRASYSETPAITGTRPATTSTMLVSSDSFSAGSSELFSPTVPSAMSPSTPSRIRASTTRCVPARSIVSSARSCVVTAG
jgi:hypothetical protein